MSITALATQSSPGIGDTKQPGLCDICCYAPNALFRAFICTRFSGARGSFLTLRAAGHAGGPPVHHGASLGPGRAPWRVLWVFKVAKSVITGSLSAEVAIARAEQDNGKPTFRLFSSTAVKRAATRSLALAFPRSYNAATDTTMRVRTTINTMRVWTLLTNVCDLCVLRVRVRVSAGLSMCVLHSNDLPSGRFMCVGMDTCM